MTLYSGLQHFNGHLLAAIDLETTGVRAGYHEIIQIAVVPLNSDLRPNPDIRPFYWNVAPKHLERADRIASKVHGLDLVEVAMHSPDADRVADMLIDWFEKLNLPFERRLIPLAHNWAFEHSFLTAWLGMTLRDKLFHCLPRDAMMLALAINDRAAFLGQKPPFAQVSLPYLCKHFGVINSKPHDAYCDCLAEAEVYRCLLTTMDS